MLKTIKASVAWRSLCKNGWVHLVTLDILALSRRDRSLKNTKIKRHQYWADHTVREKSNRMKWPPRSIETGVFSHGNSIDTGSLSLEKLWPELQARQGIKRERRWGKSTFSIHSLRKWKTGFLVRENKDCFKDERNKRQKLLSFYRFSFISLIPDTTSEE